MKVTAISKRPLWSVDTLFENLLGSWRLSRQVDEVATMTGIARFEWGKAKCLSYSETGCLALKTGTTHEAYRSYIYSESSHGFSVWFDEPVPRLFHEILIQDKGGTLCGEAAHLCGDDRYETLYCFHPDASFSIQHRVTGPRKNYLSMTTFVREEIYPEH